MIPSSAIRSMPAYASTYVASLTVPANPSAVARAHLAVTLASPLLFPSLVGLRRRKKFLATLQVACLLMVLSTAMTGCGSGPKNDAMPGTYSVPIVLRPAGEASVSTNLTIVVQ
jgi:hypothetical protein